MSNNLFLSKHSDSQMYNTLHSTFYFFFSSVANKSRVLIRPTVCWGSSHLAHPSCQGSTGSFCFVSVISPTWRDSFMSAFLFAVIQGSRTSWLCNSNQRPERCEGGQVNTKQRYTRGLIHFCVCVRPWFFCFSHRDMPLNLKSWSQQYVCRCVRTRVAVTYNHVRVFCLRVCDSENRMSGCVIFYPPPPPRSGIKGLQRKGNESHTKQRTAPSGTWEYMLFFFLAVYKCANLARQLHHSCFHDFTLTLQPIGCIKRWEVQERLARSDCSQLFWKTTEEDQRRRRSKYLLNWSTWMW